MMNRGRRLYEINMLKALAFLAVVLQSAMISYFNQPSVPVEQSVMVALIYTFIKFSAPVFIFVTGFLLFYHHFKRVVYKEFISKKIADTYVPFVIWTVIYSVLFIERPTLTLDWAGVISKQIFVGSAAPHLWYVVMVFQFHLLYPVLLVVYKKVQMKMELSKKHTFWGFFLITISYALLLMGMNHYVFDGRYLTEIIYLKYLDRSFLLYSFYFVLGGTAALYLPHWRRMVKRSFHWNSLLFIFLFVWVGYQLLTMGNVFQIELSYSSPLKPSMFLFITSQIIMLYGLSVAIVKSRGVIFRVLNFISKYTFGSYLAHFFFIKMFFSLIGDFVSTNILISSYIVFALTVVTSISFSFLVSNLPFCKMIIGPFEKVSWSRRQLVPT